MLLPPRQRGSAYLSAEESPLALHRRSLLRTLAPLLLSILLLGSVLSLGVIEPDYGQRALAVECEEEGEACDEQALSGAMSDGGYDATDEGFDEIMEEVDKKDGDGGIPEDSILYAFKRHFTFGYMNEGDKAVLASSDDENNPLGWYKDIFEARGKTNCGESWEEQAPPYYPGEEEQTLFWHNCDVPNLITEFVQDMTALFVTQGVQGATIRNSATNNPWFGYAWTMPETIDRTSADNVTAMEVFGYNLRYTSYKGEWDHIKVMTAARALSNFGFLDRLRLSTQAVLNGILGGVDSAVNTLLDDLKSGNIVRIITSPGRVISSLFGGGVSATVDTVIDTSDTNVFATMSWYRPDFGATLYNARQLSQEEISIYVEQQLLRYLSEQRSKLEEADPPEDLLPVNPDTLRKLELPNPGRCSGTYVGVKPPPPAEEGEEPGEPERIEGTVPNNVNATETEQICRNYVQTTAEAAYPDFNITVTSLNYKPRKTVQQWSDEAAWQTPVEKYQILCELNLSDPGSTDPTPVLKFLSCLDDPKIGYPAAVERETRNEQTKLNFDWFQKTFEEQQLVKYFNKQSALFTAPSSRYVCLEDDGSDMRTSEGDYVRLIIGEKQDQKYNPECNPVRKPIQNGLFGNGYLSDPQPFADTRREAFGFSIWDLLYQDELLANTGLSVTVFATRLSNTFLNLSFAPILQSTGLQTIIVSLVEALRDSLFFPLAVIVVAMAAIGAFFSAGKNRDYAAQFRNLIVMALLFVFGTVLLAAPARTLSFVDQAPAQVEAVIIGAVFEIDNEASDNLCNAGEAAVPAGSQDSWGNSVIFDPAASTRNLLCENWNVFAFRPYIYGQWGTDYESLNYDNFHAEGDQALLVGDGQGDNPPFVGLGGGGLNAERNWGLYQLDVINVGTVTTEDPIWGAGETGNMYRIVDLQAGPGGQLDTAPYADDYFRHWSGDNMGSRIMISWLSAVASIVGAVTIFFFAWAKIFISLMSMLMIVFLPIMLLIGLMPGAGTVKLKGYFLQLLSLMVQRVILAAMIALMLRIITSIAQSTDSYFLYTMMTIVSCLAFIVYRKELLSVFDKSIVGSSGGFARNMKGQVLENMPFGRTVAQTSRRVTGAISGTAYGAVGGYLNGGMAGARVAAREVRDHNLSMLTYKQAQAGLGVGLTAKSGFSKGAAAADRKANEYMEERLKPILEAQVREDFAATGLTEEEITSSMVNKQVEAQLAALKPEGVRAQMKNKAGRRGNIKTMNELRRAEDNLFEDNGPARTRELRASIDRTLASDPLEAIERENIKGKGSKPVKRDDPKADARYLNLLEEAGDDLERAFLATRNNQALVEAAQEARRRQGISEETIITDAVVDKAYLRNSAERLARSFGDESLRAVTERVAPDETDRTNHEE